MAAHRDHEDLISVGAYRRGANRLVDVAIEMQDDLNRFLRQPVQQPADFAATRDALLKLHQQAAARLRGERPAPAPAAPAARGPTPT